MACFVLGTPGRSRVFEFLGPQACQQRVQLLRDLLLLAAARCRLATPMCGTLAIDHACLLPRDGLSSIT